MSITLDFRHSLGAFDLDVRFAVARKGVTALFGPSGSGKTSIIRALAGLLRPREGHIIANDVTMFDSSKGVFVPPTERNVGLVFQDARLFPHMSVRDNLLFGWRRSKSRADQFAIDHVVALMKLDHLLERRPRKLSGGEKSRVALGRALLRSPDILLLDEPLAALDQQRRDEILPYLESLARETSLPMLYVSHTVDDVARLADEIVLLEAGRVSRQGSVFALLPHIVSDSGGGPSSVIAVQVAQDALQEGLSVLVFDGGEFIVRKTQLSPGMQTRVRIRAEDVMLARERPIAISANNILAVQIIAVRHPNDTDADVQLACGASQFVARITQASAQRLALAAGENIFAVVKSVQFERHGGFPAKN